MSGIGELLAFGACLAAWPLLFFAMRIQFRKGTAFIASTGLVLLCAAISSIAIQIGRDKTESILPATVEQALDQWKLTGFLRAHEPEVLDRWRADVKARWPLDRDGVRYMLVHFYRTHGHALFLKYAPYASDQSAVALYAVQLEIARQLRARADNTCYLYAIGHPRGVAAALETVQGFNRMLDMALHDVMRSAAKSPQSLPDPSRAGRVAEGIRRNAARHVSVSVIEQAERPDRTTHVQQLADCYWQAALGIEWAKLDLAAASAMARHFWHGAAVAPQKPGDASRPRPVPLKPPDETAR